MTYQPPKPVPGINVDQQKINAGGVSGLWGDEKDYNVFTSDPVADPNYAANRAWVSLQLGKALNQRPDELYTNDSAQWRGDQRGLSEMLFAAARGGVPSVAEQQLHAATDANNRAAASTAASVSNYGGNPAAAFKAALNQQAMNNQQAVGQTAMLRADEMATARGQLGQVLDSGRGQDMAQAQAQLAASISQRQAQQQYIERLMAEGYSQDQANYMATIQQQQFQQGSLAQQEAAKHGISTANAGQGVGIGQMVVKGIAGAASGGGAGAAKALSS